MYVRGAKKHEEVWLLDRLDEFEFEDPSFRSRDYVFAVDEETRERAGFGRLRVHTSDPKVCEFTNVGVFDGWRDQGVGAHIVERLVELASDQGFETGYALTGEGGYLLQLGFERISEDELPDPLPERLDAVRENQPDAVPFRLEFPEFEVPVRLRRRFSDADEEEDGEPQESAEDFGIDPDSATYKYDTGHR
jgi:N-acetylglutamate synthase-like GNAT family acetyltransferase